MMYTVSKSKNDSTLKIANKLNEPKTVRKTYGSILIRFLYNKNIAATFTLLVHSTFVSEFCAKANQFSEFTGINNGSRVPLFECKTKVRINSFRIDHNGISLIMKKLDFQMTKSH